MSDQRIEQVTPPYDDGLSGEFEKMMPPGVDPINLFRTIAHNPRILKKFRRGSLLDRGSITLREREIVILRTCARCGAEYEWGIHVAFFTERAGFSDTHVQATLSGDPALDAWNPKERLLIKLVDELHDTHRISHELWTRIVVEWNAEQLIELIVLTGFYHTVSFVVNGLNIELENGAPTFTDYSQ